MRGQSGIEYIGCIGPWRYMTGPQGYVTVAEASKLLGIPGRDIRRAVSSGKIDCYRISPRRSWISWKDVSEWAEARRR